MDHDPVPFEGPATDAGRWPGETGDFDRARLYDPDPDDHDADQEDGPVAPIDWRTLTADEAEAEWRALDAFVDWLRITYGLPPTIVPPLWHRHAELVWELSALHTHWLSCYEPDGSPSGPIAWHADFAEARERLREWVATSGTRLDRDRPTRATAWPGELAVEPGGERPITDRSADFDVFVAADVKARRRPSRHAAGPQQQSSDGFDQGGP